MSETYVECLVKRESSAFAKVGRIVLVMFTAVCVVLTLAGYILPFFLGVVAGFGAYFTYLHTDIEFEYLYLDKELYVDRIMAKSKRKRVASFEIDRMEILAPLKSHRLDSYRRREGKTIDYSIKREEQPDLRYMMLYDGNQKILFNPNEDLLKAIRTVAPRKVFTD